MAVAYFHVDEARSAQGGRALLESSHVVGDALEPEEFHHFRRVAPGAAAQPVARNEPPAGAQHAQDVGIDLRLVRDLNHRVLGKYDLEARCVERQCTAVHLQSADPVRQPSSLDAPPHSSDQRGIDVHADHRTRTEAGDEKLVDGAETATDIQHVAAPDIAVLEQAVELIGTARRQKSVAPEELKQFEHRGVVLAGLAQLPNLCDIVPVHDPPNSVNKALAP